MSLSIGDHVVIKRDDKVLGPEDEAYHEFEVVQMGPQDNTPPGEDPPAADGEPHPAFYHAVELKVIK